MNISAWEAMKDQDGLKWTMYIKIYSLPNPMVRNPNADHRVVYNILKFRIKMKLRSFKAFHSPWNHTWQRFNANSKIPTKELPSGFYEINNKIKKKPEFKKFKIQNIIIYKKKFCGYLSTLFPRS